MIDYKKNKIKLLNIIVFSIIFFIKIKIYTPEQYFQLCNNNILLKKEKFKKNVNPKISVISPVYNKEKTISRFLRSIQNQNFENLEIILVDDCSKDNSKIIIEKYQREDERIILLKNKKNKGTFVSRKEGALVSKGEYLIFVDPDDILINNILKFSYQTSKKNSYDIIRYNLYMGNGNIDMIKILNKIKKNPVYQPELSLYLYYGLNGINNFKQLDYYVCNKLIKRQIFITSLNSIDKYYYNKYMIDCEDGLINFFLHRNANSLYYTKNLGYYYIKSKTSITRSSNKNLQKRLSSNFLYFKFIFQYTKNNYIEKKIADCIFQRIYFIIYQKRMGYFLKLANKNDKLYEEVINMYINSKFISLKTKHIMQILKLSFKE